MELRRPYLAFLLLETGLRWGNYMGLSLVFRSGIGNNEYYLPNPFCRPLFLLCKNRPKSFNRRFQAGKNPDTRVFAVGSSAAGYPYGFNGTYSGVVKDMQDRMPDGR